MNLTLYNNTEPNNKINKVLTPVGTITGYMKTDCPVEKPIIEIDLSGMDVTTRANVTNCNYCYVQELNRYYYITAHNYTTNDLYEITLSVDVLKTYASEIINQECLIERSQFYNSPYIVDNQRMAYNFPMVLTKRFSGSFDSPHYYLTVASSVEGS